MSHSNCGWVLKSEWDGVYCTRGLASPAPCPVGGVEVVRVYGVPATVQVGDAIAWREPLGSGPYRPAFMANLNKRREN